MPFKQLSGGCGWGFTFIQLVVKVVVVYLYSVFAMVIVNHSRVLTLKGFCNFGRCISLIGKYLFLEITSFLNYVWNIALIRKSVEWLRVPALIFLQKIIKKKQSSVADIKSNKTIMILVFVSNKYTFPRRRWKKVNILNSFYWIHKYIWIDTFESIVISDSFHYFHEIHGMNWIFNLPLWEVLLFNFHKCLKS